jgi:hypothetical protein
MVGEWGRGHPADGQLRYLFDVIDHRGVEIERKEVEVPNKPVQPSADGVVSSAWRSEPGVGGG